MLTLHPTYWRCRYFRFRRAMRLTRPRRMTPRHGPKCSVSPPNRLPYPWKTSVTPKPLTTAFSASYPSPRGWCETTPGKSVRLSGRGTHPLLPVGFTRPQRWRHVQALSLPRWYHSVPASFDTGKLRRPYVERLHADIGHFGRTKTCLALARRVYFPGWCLLTGMLVRNCSTCNLCQRDNQKPWQANLKPMREFRPMAVIHADLVGPLPEGKNSRGQWGFQYILSVVDSATRYLWLLPIRHKTAECVAATLFDEVISRVSVPSAILTDRGGEFLGEVVECLLKRLGISHLKTSAYHPETDAKCERIHLSIHNMITKMIDEKHKRWPDLLGTVALAYNATVHTTTGYSPHELFYYFAPSCPLEDVVSTPASDPATNADEFALQRFECLQEATAFVREYTGKNIVFWAAESTERISRSRDGLAFAGLM